MAPEASRIKGFYRTVDKRNSDEVTKLPYCKDMVPAVYSVIWWVDEADFLPLHLRYERYLLLKREMRSVDRISVYFACGSI